MDVQEILKGEARMVGRPVGYVNAWESKQRGVDGVEHEVGVVLYETTPVQVGGFHTAESRYALVVDGRVVTSGGWGSAIEPVGEES
jgi:hypothetical protein